jgi:putative two-component system response regulator
MKERVLIIDISSENLKNLMNFLKNEYKILVAKNIDDALKLILNNPSPDLIIVDNNILLTQEELFNNFLEEEVIKEHIPVILVTNQSKDGSLKKYKVSDYVIKPFDSEILRIRVRTNIDLQKYKNRMNEKLEYQNKKFLITELVLIEGLATLAEFKDSETGSHIKRTQNYIKVMSVELKKNEKYKEILTNEVINLFFNLAPLHDIGKVGIPDSILLKTGKLTDDEFAVIKSHPKMGYDILKKLRIKLGETILLDYAIDIVYTHHEKWDGTGYPRGLKGEEIPIAGRLMALADVYDALISERVYKPAFSHEKAMEIIKEMSGTHFDPEVVEVFLKINETFKNIAQNYANIEENQDCNGDINCKIKNILIADDHEINLEIMKTQLKSMGFEISAAVNGREALNLIKEKDFDLILTDIEMPEMNGYEFIEKVRELGIDTPAFAISASDYNMNDIIAKKKGFTGFLLKPFDEEKLKFVLNKIG